MTGFFAGVGTAGVGWPGAVAVPCIVIVPVPPLYHPTLVSPQQLVTVSYPQQE
jgi:hypothetical protein